MTVEAHPTSDAAPAAAAAAAVALQEDEVEEVARTLERDATETQAGTTLERKALPDTTSRAAGIADLRSMVSGSSSAMNTHNTASICVRRCAGSARSDEGVRIWIGMEFQFDSRALTVTFLKKNVHFAFTAEPEPVTAVRGGLSS